MEEDKPSAAASSVPDGGSNRSVDAEVGQADASHAAAPSISSSGEGATSSFIEKSSSRKDKDVDSKSKPASDDKDGNKSRHSDKERERRRERSRSRSRDGHEKKRERSRSPRVRDDVDRRRRSRSRDRDYRDRRDDRDRHRDRRDRDYDYDRRRDRDRRSRSRDRYRDRRSRSRSRDRRDRDRSSGGGGSSVADLLSKVISGMAAAPPPGMVMPNMAQVAQQALAAIPSADGTPAAPVDANAAPAVDVQAALSKVNALTATAASAIANAATRPARELYIGGLPPGMGITSNALKDFFNQVMIQGGLVKTPGNPVIGARMTDNAAFGFVEFRSPEECDAAMALNGIGFVAGSSLRIGRPKGYVQQFGNVPAVVAAQIASAGAGTGMQLGGGMAAGLGLGLGGVAAASGLLGARALIPSGLIGAPVLGAGLGGGGAPSLLASLGLQGGSLMGTAASDVAAATKPAVQQQQQQLDMTPADVIMVSNLSSAVSAEQMKELFQAFGTVTHSTTVTPEQISSHAAVSALAGVLPASAPGTVRGLVRYENSALCDTVIGALQGMAIGPLPMALSRAPTSLVQAFLNSNQSQGAGGGQAGSGSDDANAGLPSALGTGASAAPSSVSSSSAAVPTRVLELHNIILAADIAGNEEEIAEIREDVQVECARYGRVAGVYIPPLSAAQRAVGQEFESVPVYVQMATEADAQAAAEKLRARKFDGRNVGVRYVQEEELVSIRSLADAAASATAEPAAPTGDAPAAAVTISAADLD